MTENLCSLQISIHAPTRGATYHGSRKICNCIYFNPRSYKRSDTPGRKISKRFCISIHAPTRGATSLMGGSTEKLAISIHAPTRGATRQAEKSVKDFVFQSTLLQEERPEGHLQRSEKPISIHAPTRGATAFMRTYCRAEIFQSTLLQEERLQLRFYPHVSHKFQSTLLQEERRDDATPYCRFKNFNPRSYKRSDNFPAEDGDHWV